MDLTPAIDYGSQRNRLLTAELMLESMIETEHEGSPRTFTYELLRILIAGAMDLIPDD